jgi:hypothetical protein
MSAACRLAGGLSHDLPQPPAYAIALHCIADLPGDREADPRGTIVSTVAHLKDEGPGRNFGRSGGSQKIRPVPQSLHGNSHGASRAAPVVRRSDACGRGPAGLSRPCGRPWWPFWRGNRDGACARACSVGTSVSRIPLRWSRHVADEWMAGGRICPERQFAGLIRDAGRLRQCDSPPEYPPCRRVYQKSELALKRP